MPRPSWSWNGWSSWWVRSPSPCSCVAFVPAVLDPVGVDGAHPGEAGPGHGQQAQASFGDISRGDVVVFERPDDDPNGYQDLIKRVIGLPGDVVEGRDGAVYVNGEAIDELPRSVDVIVDFAPITVAEGEYFMMGDNRDEERLPILRHRPRGQHPSVGRSSSAARSGRFALNGCEPTVPNEPDRA
ncbi:MAG: signal peptidase I [Acidimicrobiales bacterium]